MARRDRRRPRMRSLASLVLERWSGIELIPTYDMVRSDRRDRGGGSDTGASKVLRQVLGEMKRQTGIAMAPLLYAIIVGVVIAALINWST